MKINIITTEQEYEATVAKLDELLANYADCLDNLPAEVSNDLKLLSLVIADYEKEHFVIESPTPIEFIKFVMEQKGLMVKDIAECFGSSSRAYEVLNGKRNLTIPMIKKLRVALGCPADALI